MVKPPAAEKTSASAAVAPDPAPSTSSTDASDERKTNAQHPVPAPSSNSQQKPQKVAVQSTTASPSTAATSTASTDAKTTANASIPSSKTNADAAVMDRTLRAQEEARRLQFALAQQQVQQYQAMTKQLEAQSGIAMTPSSTISSSSSTSVAGLAKTSEDLQKLRQEQLAKLQQSVQRQAAMAAQAVQTRTNEEWMRNKVLLEKEHMRLLQLHEQQLKQTNNAKGSTVTSAGAASIADSLVTQQQHVLRQQQLLRDMLQKQQKQQHAQLQLQVQLQKGRETTTMTTVSAPSKPVITAAPTTYYSMKKRKLKTSFDTELEALAKVCIRVANARTDCEMRQALDKMTSWLHRCTELMLLQIAERDYRDSIAHRRPMMIQQDRWPLDLQVKSEFVTQKIVQMLAAFMLREKNKAAQQQAAAKAAVAASTAVATAAAASSSATTAPVASPTTTAPVAGTAAASPASTSTTGTTANPSGTAAVSTSSAVATSAAPISSVVAASVGTTAAASTTPANNTTTITTPAAPMAATTASSTTILAPAVIIPVKRDMATVKREYAELKTQLQAKQLEINQKAKAKRDAAKLEAAKAAGVYSNHATTAAMLAATYKRPLQVEIPGSLKKPRTDTYVAPSPSITAGYRPSTTSVPPISPRVAQQFYDLDLTTRTCSDSDDKMYLPPKIISKIMYRALPGTHEEEIANGTPAGVTIKREDHARGKTPSPAISPSHSAQEHDPSDSISISDDAVTFMQECVTEFLLYFTSEARDLSVMQNRRTKKGVGLSISGNNVVESMENLGFTPYARVLSGFNEKVKASQDAAARKKMERKRLIQQQAMQRAAAAAKATIAAKAAAAGKSVISPHSYANIGMRPIVPSPLARPVGASTVTLPKPVSSVSAASTGLRVMPTAKPAVVSATAASRTLASTTVSKPAATTSTATAPAPSK